MRLPKLMISDPFLSTNGHYISGAKEKHLNGPCTMRREPKAADVAKTYQKMFTQLVITTPLFLPLLRLPPPPLYYVHVTDGW